jgi:hypothetical protein
MLYVILNVILMSIAMPIVIVLSVIILSVIGGARIFNKMTHIIMTFSIALD